MTALAALVLATFLDYGLTWDEEFQRTYGNLVLAWYQSLFRDQGALTYRNLYVYGAFSDVVANLAAGLLPFGDYESRHLVNGIFGIVAVGYTWRLGTLLGGPRVGFLSGLFLALTPAFYGHLFNNPKDIPFAALFAVSLYYMYASARLLPRLPASMIAKLGIAVGLTLGTRPGGVFVFSYLGLLWLGALLLPGEHQADGGRRRPLVRASVSFTAVVVMAWAVMLVFWPWAQTGPLTKPIEAIREASRFSRGAAETLMRFEGRSVMANAAPWNYIPVWFSVVLPEFYFVAAGIGVVALPRSLRRRSSILRAQGLEVGVLALTVVLPVAAAILLHSTVYDSIRHFLFLLPALAILAGLATSAALDRGFPKALRVTAVSAVLASCALTALDMVQLHPYESVYFNRLVAGGLHAAADRFETDYWGSSYREGIEWVIDHYQVPPGTKAKVANCSYPALTGYYIEKDPRARERFTQMDKFEEGADLFLATTRFACHEMYPGRVLHTVERQGTPLLYVLEVKRPR